MACTLQTSQDPDVTSIYARRDGKLFREEALVQFENSCCGPSQGVDVHQQGRHGKAERHLSPCAQLHDEWHLVQMSIPLHIAHTVFIAVTYTVLRACNIEEKGLERMHEPRGQYSCH